jgi:hypothetical protein
MLACAGLVVSANRGRASDLRIDGKCAVPELSLAIPDCTILQQPDGIAVLSGRNLRLSLTILPSAIVRSGRLTPELEAQSPLLRLRLSSSLAQLNTDLDDARASTNVRAVQFRSDTGLETLVVIADRRRTASGALEAALPSRSGPSSATLSETPQIAPSEASRILREFELALERIQSLYEHLMFEEGDRVLDLLIAETINFNNSYSRYEGSQQITAFLNSQINQLQALRALKSYERNLEEQSSEWNYNQRQAAIYREQQRQLEQAYRLATEVRRAAEASARSWWALWLGQPTTTVIIRSAEGDRNDQLHCGGSDAFLFGG